MRRTIAFLLTAVLSLSLAACGANNSAARLKLRTAVSKKAIVLLIVCFLLYHLVFMVIFNFYRYL
ncbi:MAG: hypothetical protein J6K26_10015, partial [Lachnospiraceae bacterium]|nr:hypothetical protein [Lachnospiraceae bacterium]